MNNRSHSPQHHIQKRIFRRLVVANGLRYSELKPADIEANSFMYHLKELIKAGLVSKSDGAYLLSPAGKTFATRFSLQQSGERVMPTTISSIFITNEKQETMLYRKKRQPDMGAVSLPSGKIHYGETLRDAAIREAYEKTGYKNLDLKMAGTVNSLVHLENGETSHAVFIVWKGMAEGKPAQLEHSEPSFWAKPKNLSGERFSAGFFDILEALSSDKMFFLDLEHDL